MRCVSRRSFALMILVLLAWSPTARSGQKLITPGQKWDDVVHAAKPGDVIVLMPGEHRPGKITDHGGTIDQPIIIRGVDADHPAIIKGARYGLSITRPGHLVFKNIVIEGAEVNGVLIDASTRSRNKFLVKDPETEAETTKSTEPGSVKLVNVTIRNTGSKKDKRNAIELYHAQNVTIENCLIESWSDVGVEIIGSSIVTIDSCSFMGSSTMNPTAGIRARAGTTNVNIVNCRFFDCGLTGVCAGGISRFKHFPDEKLEDTKVASIFEARHVSIEKSLFVGGASAITLSHCDRVQINRNSIVNPKYYVFCLLRISHDNFLGDTRRCTFEQNLVTWEPDSMEKFFLIDKGVELKTIKMEANLWWSSEPVESWTRLGEIPESGHVAQLFEIDPRLSDQFVPTSLKANGYGAFSIQIAQPGDEKPPIGQ